MLEAKCHCGAVRLTISARPDYVNNCNCSLCQKAGAVWGYFGRAKVSVVGATANYVRTDKPDPACRLHFCASCGSTTHWTLTESFMAQRPDADLMGVNMRLFDSAGLVGVEVRYPDGRAWDGESAHGYRRDSVPLSDGEAL